MEQASELTYLGKPRTCGFRFFTTDGVVLALGGAAGALGWIYGGGIGLIPPFVVLHFFLFCNVFRVRRKPELVWAGTFLLNCAAWSVAGRFQVAWIFAIQFLVTIAIILAEIRSPYYHGVFSRRINPQIHDYLDGKI